MYFLLKVLLDKIEKTNKSKNKEVAHEEEKRSIIDGKKNLLPRTNTAEVVQESRKEPALPQESIVGKLPAGNLKPPDENKILKLAEQKLVQQHATTSENIDVRNLPAEKEVKPDLSDMLKRLSANADLKPKKAELKNGEEQTIGRDSVKDTLKLREEILKKEDLPVGCESFFLSVDLTFLCMQIILLCCSGRGLGGHL